MASFSFVFLTIHLQIMKFYLFVTAKNQNFRNRFQHFEG